jgi:hypothetical protein
MTPSPSRIKHFHVRTAPSIIIFGLFTQSPGQTIENLQRPNATLPNLLDPYQPRIDKQSKVHGPSAGAIRGQR